MLPLNSILHHARQTADQLHPSRLTFALCSQFVAVQQRREQWGEFLFVFAALLLLEFTLVVLGPTQSSIPPG